MDWCIGNSLQELVPQDQEKFQSFQSHENWSRWEELSASGCQNPPHKFFGMDGYITPTQSFRGLSDGSSSQETSSLDCQLHNFSGIQHMDDIFLDSFLEDVPGNRDMQESFCSVSSARNHGFQPADDDNVLDGFGFDSQSILDGNNRMDCSSYFQTQDEICYPSERFDSGDDSVFPFISSTSEKLDSIPSKGATEENRADIYSEEQSLEESVLQEFQSVMEKLTEQSRICFRDTFYRLAKTSEQKSLSRSSNVILSSKAPRTCQDSKTRPGREKTVESETNAVDRAVASLTFNKMDSNVCDFLLAGSINSEESFIQMVESPDSQSYYQQIQHLPHTPGGIADAAEVPVFVWKNPDVKSQQA